MIIALSASAQYTYVATYHDGAGNPGGLNTDGDATTTGWNNEIAGSAASNSWSSAIALPFAFDFYGSPVTHLKVSGNGVVTFDTMTTAPPVDANTNLPAAASTNVPANSILMFWDAFTGGAPTGSNDVVYSKTFGTAPNRQFWIRYHSYEYGVNAAGTSHQSSFTYWGMCLEESTNKIYIVDMNYHSAGTGLTTTVGVQNGTVATQWMDSTLAMNSGGSSNTDNDYYEFNPILLLPNNAGITSIDEPTLPLTPGLKDVKVTLKNHGNNALTSTTINWAVNGAVQTPFSWTGNLASQTSTASPVTLGQFNFATGNSLIEAWTSLPNGMADPEPSNDTASTSACTSLSGTFTVGGAGANYPDIASALAAVEMCGISGPITFNVAAGTYSGEVSLSSIPGVTATNNITVNGAGMGSTILTYDKTGTNNAALLLDGASYVTFKNMTIENTATSTQTWGVRLVGNAHHITFDSCKISTYNTATSSSVATVVATNSPTSAFSYANNANYITISNSELVGGYYGVRFNGLAGSSGSGYNVGNQVLNTKVYDHYAYGLYGIYQDSFTVNKCVVEPSRATFGYGIYATQNRNPFFEGNWIKDCETYAIGIFSTNTASQGATGVRGRVVNNMVTSKNFGEGLYFSTVNDVDVFHNSVYSDGEQALYHGGVATGMDYRNNILSTAGAPVVDFTSAFPGAATFDYNIVHRRDNGPVAEESTYSAPSLADWKVANPAQNQNSLDGDPNYVDPTNHDLHVGIGAGLISGDNSAGVTVDFDGDARPYAPTTVVDIGADEIFVQNLDAGVVALDAPSAPVTAGLQNFDVTIKNNGATPLTAVTVNWSVDGAVQTPFSWTGNLTIGQEASNVTIGQYNVMNGFSNVVAWTSAPNGGTDGDPSNDTLYQSICTALSGSYTVGPDPTDDFATISAAVAAVSDCGVAGPVSVTIAPGVYNESVLVLEAAGAGAANKIVFDGGHKDSVTITHAGNSGGQNAVILFDGGDYYTFQNMTIENTGTTYGWGVRLFNGADNNTIKDNRIRVPISTSSIAGAGVITSATATSAASGTGGNNANDLRVDGNEIIGGYYAVTLIGAFVSGSSDGHLENNTVINNHIDSTYGYGVFSTYQKDVNISNNTMLDSDGNFYGTFGYGVYIGDALGPNVQANYIVGAPTRGIYLFDINFDFYSPKAGNVINNMVQVYSTDDALYFDDVEKMNVYHNTLVAENGQAFYGNDLDTMDIRNNIFATLGANNNTNSEPFEYLDAMGPNDIVDYNLYYDAAGGDIAEIGTAFYADLNAWLTADATRNVKSVEGDPLFFDASIGDLHLLGGLANDVGDNTVGVPRDIDLESRPQAPSTVVDIGADEYTPLLDDLTMLEVFVKTPACNSANDSVWAVVQSIGLNPVLAFNVNVDVSGATTASISAAAATNISIGGIDTVLVGTFNSSGGGIYNLEGYVTLTGDQDATNDTSAVVSVQRMAPPNGTIVDVACQGDSTGSITLDFIGTGALATVNQEQNIVAPPSGTSTYTFGGFAIDNVQLIVDANGDLDGTAGNLEQFDIFDENGINIGFIGATGNFADQCNDIQKTISIPQADYNAYAADGVITFTAIPTAAVNTGTLCPNAFLKLTLTGNGEPDIMWNTGDTTAQITGLAAGTYTATVTDLLGCTQTASFTVNQSTNPSPSITASAGTDVSCFGFGDGSATITATGGTGTLAYTWSSGDTLSNAANLAPGTYSVIVSDVNGCSDSTTVTITQPDTLVAGNAGVTVAGCDSFLVATSVAGGTTPYAYSWTGGIIGSSLLVTATGTYVATVTDANGCTDTLSATVTLPPALAATATETASDTSGAGLGAATVTASGGTGPYTYLWSNGATTATADSLIFGNYTVTVTDANGCSETASVAINFPVNTNNLTVMGNIEMFPNPTSGQVTLNVALKQTSDLTITIFNAIGQEVFTLHEGTTDNVQTQFDMSQMAGGVYMVRFSAGNDVVTKRLIVRK
jgi:hypothetical protein